MLYILIAAKDNNINIMKYLYSIDNSYSLDTVYDIALENGNLEIIQWLHDNLKITNVDICRIAWRYEHKHILDWMKENKNCTCIYHSINVD
jgi:hypothetical protein